MKTILVPTDFSKNAALALKYAVMIAKIEKAKISLLHSANLVYSTPDLQGQMIVAEAEEKDIESNKKLKVICDNVKKRNKIKCNYNCEHGLVIDVILDEVKKIKPDFIILGTKGASGMKKVLIGSNAAKVVSSNVRCPVLIVPEKTSVKSIKKIDYATDYLFSDVVAIKQVVEIARLFKARVTVIHIADGEYLEYEEIEMLKRFEKKVIKKVNYDDIHFLLIDGTGKRIDLGLETYLRKNPADLLAMSTLQKNLLERFVSNSATKQMVYHTHIPLLVFHHKKRSVLFI